MAKAICRNMCYEYTIYGILLILFFAGCSHPDPPVVEEDTGGVQIVFTDVTEDVGLGDFRHQTGAFGEKWFPETMGAGGGFLDYDGDGIQDILLIAGSEFLEQGMSSTSSIRLYRGSKDGKFIEVTQESGLASLQVYGFGISVADYDNDNDPDVFVTTLYNNLLLRNHGGVFRDVSMEAGLGTHSEWSTASVFLDVDLDGWLDLYVGNYVHWTPEDDIYCTREGEKKSYCTPEQYRGLAGRFYRNQGDGTFLEQSDDFRGLPGKTLGAAGADFNRDGWPDLIIANDTQRDLLFENQGNGTFIEKGMASGIAFDEHGQARAGMGIDIGVVDHTGRETVFIGHFSGEMVGVYRHVGRGIFVERAAVSQIGRPSLYTLTFGLLLADLDLDGDLDLVTANGHIIEDISEVEEGVTFRQRAQLYINVGQGRFSESAPVGVLSELMVARGLAWADYDQDGDIDLLITENGGPVHLWRNDTVGGRSLTVKLIGSESNRNAVGARVRLNVGGIWQQRYVRTGGSYLSQSQLWPLFGLGATVSVDSLEVQWPSGFVTRYTHILPGSVTLVESQEEVDSIHDDY